MLRKRRILIRALAVLLMIFLCTAPYQAPMAIASGTSTTLNILEVQPGTTYDLTASFLAATFPNYTLDITQMSMAEFISKVDEINGEYDIVYIGDNTSGGVQYTAQGKAAAYLPICKTPTKNGSGSNSMEYYSDNDITNRRADTLKEFITSKQLTIFDKSIFSLGPAFKLVSNFSSFVNNSTYPSFLTVDTSNSRTKSTNLRAVFSVYANAVKRPALTLTSQPRQYDGTDDSYSSDNFLGYAYTISNLNNAAMKVELYIDINGDGIFSTSEVVAQKDYTTTSAAGSLNYPANSFVGLQPWKLEVINEATGAKAYKLGTTAFKAANSEGELNVRVLQLEPNDNTFSVYSLHNIKGLNLLYKENVYNIQVTEMSVANFNAAYASSADNPQPVSATVNGTNKSAPTALNSNYDMIILGFSDSYGGNDLNANAIKALQSFIDTNQSVMFTHDTIQYHLPIDANAFSGSYNLTDSFRKLVGQQRYYLSSEMTDSNRHYDAMPNADKYTYGYANRLLDRFSTGSRVGLDTTTKAYKVNENLVTQFPFVLGDIPVAETHYQWFQLDLEDPDVVPVYTLYDNSVYKNRGDGRNDYYTYTQGNITYSGTGHSSVSADNNIDEEKMFVNTIIKASRGANHAPTLVVNGISDNMDISKTLKEINFTFTATDIDPKDQYLNADIYLSTDNGITYQNVQHFDAADPDSRVTNGVAKSVSVPTVNSSINTYKIKIVAYDAYNAQASQEVKLNCVNDPSITVASSVSPTCLVGDTLDIPVTLTAQTTGLSQNFTNINLKGVLTAPGNFSTNVYSSIYPNLQFTPTPSWGSQQNSFPVTFGMMGNPNSAGTYTISNQLAYSVNNSAINPTPVTSSVTVYSGTIGASVSDQNGKPITGVSLKLIKDSDGSTVASGSTSSSGYYTFSGLSSGDYTVTVDNIPSGRTIVGNSSIKTSLSASNYQQEISFTMGGTLISNPTLSASDGSSQMTAMKDEPFQTVMGIDLTRPASSLNLMLDTDLSNSIASFTITKVACNNQDVAFISDADNQGIIMPQDSSIPFPSGTYTISATVTMTDGTMQPGQNFTLQLDPQTSATDANTTSEEAIGSPSLPLTVNVMSMLTNPSLTTRSGGSQMDTLINAPLQTNVGLTLMGPASFLTIDLTNSLSGSSTNLAITKVLCENQGQVEDIGFTADTSNPGKLFPSGLTSFPSGNYTIYTTVTISGATMKTGDSYTVSLTLKTSAQDAGTGNVVYIGTVPSPITVYVLDAPKYH